MPDPTEVAAIVRAAANDEGERYPCALGVFCDRCGEDWSGDFIVHTGMTQTDRFAVVRGHLVEHEGWQCDADGDLCPACKPVVFQLDVPMLVHPKAHGPASQPCEPLNANWRLHWTSYNERVGAIRHGIVTAAKAAKIPVCRHLTVTLHYRPGDNRRRDADNLTPTLKAACDALARGPRRDWVGLELVPDDTPAHMTKRMPEIHPGPGPRRLWLTVEVQR